MPRYDIYGVGNALVDIEYDLGIEQLLALEVDKGLMTLIEEDRHHQLLAQLSELQGRMSGGGSAANTITAAAQLGGKAFYSCKVANDESGHFFLRQLAALGIDSNLAPATLEAGITGKCLVLVTPDADRTMNTFLGATRQFSERELNADAIAAATWLYIEGYLVPEPHARQAATKARQIAEAADVRTALTLSDPNMVQYFSEGLHEIAGNNLDLCFANEQEARLMFKADTLEQCVRAMKQFASRFVITLGPDGALLYDGQDEITIPAPRVKAIDTNGCGDIFAGSFLYGLTHQMSFLQAGQLATEIASFLTTQHGARLPQAVMQEKLRKFQAR